MNIDRKSAFSKVVGQFRPNSHVIGDFVNILQLCRIYTKKLCSRLSSSQVHFLTKNYIFCVF